MIFCPGCGRQMQEFVIFCPSCGFNYKDYQEKMMRQQVGQNYGSQPRTQERVNVNTVYPGTSGQYPAGTVQPMPVPGQYPAGTVQPMPVPGQYPAGTAQPMPVPGQYPAGTAQPSPIPVQRPFDGQQSAYMSGQETGAFQQPAPFSGNYPSANQTIVYPGGVTYPVRGGKTFPAAGTAPAENLPDDEEPKTRKKSKIGIIIACIAAVCVIAAGAVIMTLMLPKKEEGFVVNEIKMETLSDNELTVTSDCTSPFVVFYSGNDENINCVYMKDGKGSYYGKYSDALLGYAETDESIYMSEIETVRQFYQYTDTSSYNCVLEFNLKFNEKKDGIFIYDIALGNNNYKKNCMIPVSDGVCRVEEFIQELSSKNIDARLDPVCFIPAEELTGDIDFSTDNLRFKVDDHVAVSSYSDSVRLPQKDEDYTKSIILYQYKVTEGGSEFELNKESYACGYNHYSDYFKVSFEQYFHGKTSSQPKYRMNYLGYVRLTSLDETGE